MALNHNGNCQTNFMTSDEAIKGGTTTRLMNRLPCQSQEEKVEPKYKIKLKLHKNLSSKEIQMVVQ